MSSRISFALAAAEYDMGDVNFTSDKIDRVREAYKKLKRGEITQEAWGDVVDSVLAQTRIENGI